MTVQQFISESVKELRTAGVTTARLDCLVILEDATGYDRAWLLAHPEHRLNDKLLKLLSRQVADRARHIPLAYIRGKTEFYGRYFIINPVVLDPRPESETMIEQLIAFANELDKPHIVDIGTGSGALGITAALELPGSQVTLLDIDDRALKVAELNCRKHQLDLSCRREDLLSTTVEQRQKKGQRFDIILANLPYVPNDFHINTAALHEPRQAIFGGPDGLDLYRRLFGQLKAVQPSYVLTEALPFQHPALTHIADASGFRLQKEVDFIQVFSYWRRRV